MAATSAAQGPPVTVVGAGNWMLTHDRIGPAVLENIKGRYGPQVELRTVGTHGLGLLDELRGQDLLLVVDACILGGDPGQVHVMDPDLEAPMGRQSSVHQIGPLEVLALCSRLTPEALPGRTRLLLVESEGLSEQGEQEACARVVAELDREIAAWEQKQNSAMSQE